MRSPRLVAPLLPGQHVVIIGAGPAGLTAGYLLSKEGVRSTILEADDIVGGISRTAQYKGFRFDIGGHRFFTKIEAVQSLWEEILGEEFITVPRLSRIYYDGKFFDYPLKAGNALRGLGLINALMIVASFVKWRCRPYPVEDTFRAVGHEPVRQAPVRDLLQDVHREGLGSSVRRDPRRVGGPTHPESLARQGDPRPSLRSTSGRRRSRP